MVEILGYLLVLIVGIYIGAYLSYKGTALAIKKLQAVHKEELKELFNSMRGNNYGQG